jgi:hypothetical protein
MKAPDGWFWTLAHDDEGMLKKMPADVVKCILNSTEFQESDFFLN